MSTTEGETRLKEVGGVAGRGKQVVPEGDLGLPGAVDDRLEELGELLDEGDDTRQEGVWNHHTGDRYRTPHTLQHTPYTTHPTQWTTVWRNSGNSWTKDTRQEGVWNHLYKQKFI